MKFPTLSELAELFGGEVLIDAPGRPSSVDIDTRRLRPEGLFFAFRGEQTDGHRFLQVAKDKQAFAAVVEDVEAAREAGLAAVRVDSVGEALLQLAAWGRRQRKHPIVGITGTNGKTSTKDVLSVLLGRKLNCVKSQGNFNNLLGMPISLLNAPDPADLGIFEMGMSSRGEIDRMAKILRPEFGILTNVSRAHTEFLGSLEEVRAAKGELIPHVAPGGTLYLNADDASTRWFEAEAQAQDRDLRVRKVSIQGSLEAAAHAEILEANLRGTRCRVSLDPPQGGRPVHFEIFWPIPGQHMLYPLLFALLVAQDLGLELGPEEITAAAQDGLAATGGRLKIRKVGGVELIDDSYNANPASMDAALDFLIQAPVPGRRWAVLGDMRELGEIEESCHRAVIERLSLADSIHGAWLVGDLFGEAVFQSSFPNLKIQVTQDPNKVVAALARDIQPGDVILFKGSRSIGLDRVLASLEAELE